MTEQTKTLIEWHKELRELAIAKGAAFLVCTDPETHREAYEDGLTVEDELAEQVSCCQ